MYWESGSGLPDLSDKSVLQKSEKTSVRLHGESNSMTQNYELIVKGIRNFENKVTVTLALQDKNALTVKFFDWTSRWTVLKVPLEFYEAAARRSIRQVFRKLLPGYVKG